MSDKRVKRCAVIVCKNTSANEPKKIFIRVPSNPNKKAKWSKSLQYNLGHVSRSFVCEDHFNLSIDAENWMYFKTLGKTIILKDHVVPHKFIDNPPSAPLPNQISDASKKRKAENLVAGCSNDCDDSSPSRIKCAKIQLFEKSRIDNCTPSKEIEEIYIVDQVKTKSTSGPFAVEKYKAKNYKYENYAMQASNTKEITTMDVTINPNLNHVQLSKDSANSFLNDSETMLSSSSDLNKAKFKCFNALNKSSIQLILLEPRFYLGLPKYCYVLTKLLSSWTNLNHADILLTLRKIRLNDTFSILGDNFGMSTSDASNIFSKTVPKLANCMQNFISWPDLLTTKKAFPVPFSRAQSIIDCFEIEIDKPSNSLQQALTWSQYKCCNTLKILISCTPTGFINFISSPIAGRITNNNIVIKSKYLNSLPNNVDIMADCGFKHIGDLLSRKNCHLMRPPSVSLKSKLSKDEVRLDNTLRIHIERVIKRIRAFEILHNMHSELNKKLFSLINEIIIISCGIINVKESLIK